VGQRQSARGSAWVRQFGCEDEVAAVMAKTAQRTRIGLFSAMKWANLARLISAGCISARQGR